MDILSNIYCFTCKTHTNLDNPIVFKRTGDRYFRIATLCPICQRLKSKGFYDYKNLLPDIFYTLKQNQLCINYIPNKNGDIFLKDLIYSSLYQPLF